MIILSYLRGNGLHISIWNEFVSPGQQIIATDELEKLPGAAARTDKWKTSVEENLFCYRELQLIIGSFICLTIRYRARSWRVFVWFGEGEVYVDEIN